MAYIPAGLECPADTRPVVAVVDMLADPEMSCPLADMPLVAADIPPDPELADMPLVAVSIPAGSEMSCPLADTPLVAADTLVGAHRVVSAGDTGPSLNPLFKRFTQIQYSQLKISTNDRHIW